MTAADRTGPNSEAAPQRKRSRSQSAEYFHRFAKKNSQVAGSAWAFAAAVFLILAWLATGPLFGFSDTWQLVINTTTTVVTFLMVFIIQNSQNRDSLAVHLKLDELLRAIKAARNDLIDLEDLTEEELATLSEQFKKLRDLPQDTADREAETPR